MNKNFIFSKIKTLNKNRIDRFFIYVPLDLPLAYFVLDGEIMEFSPVLNSTQDFEVTEQRLRILQECDDCGQAFSQKVFKEELPKSCFLQPYFWS